MRNFTYYNPTRIVFGKGTIAQLGALIPEERRVLMTYGGGSIRRNGVYDQVAKAMQGRTLLEFGGIEPNPRYETLMKAVALARAESIDFLLAVGGGSVLDGTKFIAAALPFDGEDPWDLCAKQTPVHSALPIGSVLTLPATGSESNGNAVISRESTQEKLAFISEQVFPRFAILDPQTTISLPLRQTQNGIIDAFIHVMEQYMTYPVNAPLQDRYAESILRTLIEEGPKVIENPQDYDARANIMWCATQALNMLIACGVPQDWATHAIGHELTALYGIDHARSLAAVHPALLRYRREQKAEKLVQYAERVWDIHEGDDPLRIETAITKTEAFFQSLGVKTKLSAYDATEGLERVGRRIESRGRILGERQDITRADIDAILALCKA